MRKLSEAGERERNRRISSRTYDASRLLDRFLDQTTIVLSFGDYDRAVDKIVRTLDFLDADLK